MHIHLSFNLFIWAPFNFIFRIDNCSVMIDWILPEALGCRWLRTIVQPSISSGFMGILFSRMFPWLPSTSHNFRNCREYCGRSIGRQVADWEVLGWQWWGWAAVARRRPLACYSHASPMSVCPIITIYMPHNYQNIDLKLIDWRKISWRFEEWMCYFTATKFNSGPLITIAPLLHTKKNAQLVVQLNLVSCPTR